jgi:hypothetical protein
VSSSQEEVGELLLQLSCSVENRIRIERKALQQLLAAFIKCKNWTSKKTLRTSVLMSKMKDTLATALGGYSLLSFGSTHCFTLSSLNLGVACQRAQLLDKGTMIWFLYIPSSITHFIHNFRLPFH